VREMQPFWKGRRRPETNQGFRGRPWRAAVAENALYYGWTRSCRQGLPLRKEGIVIGF
jgi:hypothetical protein